MNERLKDYLLQPDFSDKMVATVRDEEWNREVAVALEKMTPRMYVKTMSDEQITDVMRGRVAEVLMVGGLRDFASTVTDVSDLEVMEKAEGARMKIGSPYNLDFHSTHAAFIRKENNKRPEAEIDAVAINGPELYLFDATTSRLIESRKSKPDDYFRRIRHHVRSLFDAGLTDVSPYQELHKIHVVYSKEGKDTQKPFLCKDGVSLIKIPSMRPVLDQLTTDIVQKARDLLRVPVLLKAS